MPLRGAVKQFGPGWLTVFDKLWQTDYFKEHYTEAHDKFFRQFDFALFLNLFKSDIGLQAVNDLKPENLIFKGGQ